MKTSPARHFEDFEQGEAIRHASPRTLTAGDVALHAALYGARFAVQSSEHFAREIGYRHAPVDDLLVLQVTLGEAAPEIPAHAGEEAGLSQAIFLRPLFVGDTLWAVSEILGRESVAGERTGWLDIRTTGFNHHGERVVVARRSRRVAKRDAASAVHEPAGEPVAECVAPAGLGAAAPKDAVASYDYDLAGSPFGWGDYESGERIDHVDGMAVSGAEERLARGLWRTAVTRRAANAGAGEAIGAAHALSIARTLTFNGLANAFHIAAINGARHLAPLAAGDTVHAWSEILDKAEASGRDDVGLLRVRTIATRNKPQADFPEPSARAGAVLDFDYWVVVPR